MLGARAARRGSGERAVERSSMSLAAGTKLGPYDRRSAYSESWLRHRRAALGRRSIARLDSSRRYAPAARTSSLPSVGRLFAPRTFARVPLKELI
jgi:hypothetical protein